MKLKILMTCVAVLLGTLSMFSVAIETEDDIDILEMGDELDNITTVEPVTTASSLGTTDFSSIVTVSPTAIPKLFPTYYIVDRSTGVVCLMVQIQAHFRIPYARNDGTTVTKDVDFNPVSARAEGECENGTQTISIQWRPLTMRKSITDSWDLEFTFNVITSSTSNQTIREYALASISLIYILEEGTFPYVKTPGKHQNTLSVDQNLFTIPLNGTYHCTTEQTFSFPSDNIEMDTRTFKLQAFRTRNDTIFSATGIHCPKDQAINTIVPIVVGSLLIVQVLGVLIAYYVTHRSEKNVQRSSYEPF
jgi:hypothetical protein